MAAHHPRRGLWLRRMLTRPVAALVAIAAILAFVLLSATAPPVTHAQDEDEGRVVITFFWGDGCPHCGHEKDFLADLVTRYPEIAVEAYEVWYHPENRELFLEMAADHGFEPSAVPTTFLAGRYWVGFTEEIGRQIEAVAVAELERLTPTPPVEPTPPPPEPQEETIELPFFGRIAVGSTPLVVTTALIGLVDGFNPCSLWVLSVLLAMMLHSGSRRRLFAVGITFLVVTAVAYGVFMIGLFTVLDWIGYATWVRVVMAAIVLVFGVVAIKDYFWLGRGISFSIPEHRKPEIYRRSRELALPERPLGMLLPLTAILAAGVALLELPCTAGFPVMWNAILLERGVVGGEFAGLLGVYLAVYLADELVLFTVAVVTLRATRLQEEHGRGLKLVAGSLMLALATVMLLAPSLLETVTGAVAVFVAALAAALLVMIVHRRLLPRLGVQIGDPT